MDHFSTVLQRPPHFNEDGSNGAVGSEDRGPRGGLRDILNPVSSTTQAPGTPGASAPPRPQSSFSLRSPTQQSDYQHPNAYGASPSAIPSRPSGSRSILNNSSFGPAPAPSLPPPLQAPPSIGPATTSSGLQHPPRSPLHAPPAYYPQDTRDRESIREKSTSGGFYDPTTDRNRERERRVSETGSWHTSAQTSPPKVSKVISILGKPSNSHCQALRLRYLPLSPTHPLPHPLSPIESSDLPSPLSLWPTSNHWHADTTTISTRSKT